MNIEQSRTGTKIQLTLAGRLDAYWAPHLSNELEQVIRDGVDDVTIDVRKVDFLSSAGIGILLKYYKLLVGINGMLRVVNPTDTVLSVLELSGLTNLLLASREAPAQSRAPAVVSDLSTIERDGMVLRVYPADPQPAMTVSVLGNTAKLERERFQSGDEVLKPFGLQSIALGIGAFGKSFDECKDQYGEFLSVAGTSVALPSNRTSVPDFETARGTFVPKVNVLYGVHCSGTPSQFLRFESSDPLSGIPLSRLAGSFFDVMSKTDSIVYVLLGITSGLIGASLRRSPAASVEGSLFAHPDIRQWLSYTSEPAFGKSLVLAVGIISRGERNDLHGFLNPMDRTNGLFGHTHAVACTYHHLQKGKLDLFPTVSGMFEHDTPVGMLHLVRDDRPLTGRGESEFVRGAVWLGKLV
jgi:anti-anti-sigma factor